MARKEGIVSLGNNASRFIVPPQCGGTRGLERSHPIETSPFVEVKAGAGLKGRARDRWKYQSMVSAWTNCILGTFKDLMNGRLSNKLLQAAGGSQDVWVNPDQVTENGVALTQRIHERVGEVLKDRPVDFPQQPSASVRMVQAQRSPGGPTAKEAGQSQLPVRGEIWPARIEDISRPPAGTKSRDLREVSQDLKKKFDNFTTEMLRSPESYQKVRIESKLKETPYVDPMIEKDIYTLAYRMAIAGMLRGCQHSKSTVGLFTVVKKIEEGTNRIILRLVLDQRVPNLMWGDPPWTPLSGPGVFAGVDLSTGVKNFEQESHGVPPQDSYESYILKGDIPDCFYRWGITPAMSQFFVLPGVNCQKLMAMLRNSGEHQIVEDILEGQDENQVKHVGLSVVAMGWSWAVYLAQEALLSIFEDAGEEIQVEESLKENPFGNRMEMVEGGPAPLMRPGAPLPFAYIDDFGMISFGLKGQIDRDKVKRWHLKVKSKIMSYGLPVHKEEEGDRSVTIGVEIGGAPPVVQPTGKRRFDAMMKLWALGKNGKSSCAAVDSAVALSTWMFMVCRGCLSIYQEVYPWIQKHRESHGVLLIPMEVRRELLAAAIMVLMIGQDLSMAWNPKVFMFDASTEGGGIVETIASWEELTKESRWAIRGNWITRTVVPSEIFDHYRPDEEAPEKIIVSMPKEVEVVAVFHFLHMFSGLQREGDLEYYLIRLGAACGMRVKVISMDLAYGKHFDLSSEESVKELELEAERKKFSGAHNGSPCSTWSRVRFRPGGPPPLRDRSSPWGLATNSNSQREHVELHNKLLRNSLRILLAVALSSGLVSNEHPVDPGTHPYPSTWNLAIMKRVEKLAGMVRTVFPQCLWGLCSRKLTCLSSNLSKANELDVHGGGKCYHKTHAMLCGLDEEGKFMTRRAQTYPPQLCEKLAQCFIEDWRNGKGNPEWVSPKELELQDNEDDEEDYVMGEKIPVPEVSRVWDDIDRWSETSRWTWKNQEEHNNILEGRAGIVSAKIASMHPSQWDCRALLISDSQVVISAFSKGRSSKLTINHLARKLCAMSLACNVRFYYRYIRTHRNHADGPSRGYPIGVAPKSVEEQDVLEKSKDGRGPKNYQLKALPEIFYRTSG